MKKLRLFSIVVLSSILLFSACNNDDDDNNSTTTPSTPSSGTNCYLSEIYKDSTLNAKFEMNSSNQLIKITEYDENGSVNKYTTITYSNNLPSELTTYNNADLIQSKNVYEATNGKITEVKFYQLNDSTNELEYTMYIKYIYNNDKIITAEYYDSETDEKNFYISYEWNGDNIQKDEFYAKYQNQYILFNTESYVFDTKNTPYKNFVGIKHLNSFTMNANNIIKKTVIDYQQQTSTTNYIYEYNDKSFPVKQTETDNDGNTTVYTFNYIYK